MIMLNNSLIIENHTALTLIISLSVLLYFMFEIVNDLQQYYTIYMMLIHFDLISQYMLILNGLM